MDEATYRIKLAQLEEACLCVRGEYYLQATDGVVT